MLSDYVRIGTAARYLGVPITTLRHWCKQKKVPHYLGKGNGQRYFKPQDLQEIKEKMRAEFGLRGCKRYFRRCKLKKKRKSSAHDMMPTTTSKENG